MRSPSMLFRRPLSLALPFALALGCQSGSEGTKSGAATAAVQPVANNPTAVAPPALAPAPEAPPAPAAAGDAAGPTKLGAPLGSSPFVALASIGKNASKYTKQPVRTEGKVTAVCQAMGCWME